MAMSITIIMIDSYLIVGNFSYGANIHIFHMRVLHTKIKSAKIWTFYVNLELATLSKPTQRLVIRHSTEAESKMLGVRSCCAVGHTWTAWAWSGIRNIFYGLFGHKLHQRKLPTIHYMSGLTVVQQIWYAHNSFVSVCTRILWYQFAIHCRVQCVCLKL